MVGWNVGSLRVNTVILDGLRHGLDIPVLDSAPKPDIWRYGDKFSYRDATKEVKKAFKKDLEKAKKRLNAMEMLRPLLAEHKNDSRMNEMLKIRMKGYEGGVDKIAEIEQFIIWCREISGISE